MSDFSRMIIAILLMVTPWVCYDLGKQTAEEEIKAKEIKAKLEIFKKFLKENKHD